MALTEDVLRTHKIFDTTSIPVKETTTIYKGSLVGVDATGYAIVMADTAGIRFAGVAIDGVDNSSGSSGDLNVTVDNLKVQKITCSGATQAWVGAMMYAVDDDTVALIATTTNDIIVGVCVGYISATQVWVYTNGTEEELTGLTSSMAELNILTGATVTYTELNYLDKAAAVGVQEASKAVVADANINTGVSKVTEIHVGVSGSEEKLLATPLEINRICDSSAKIVTTTANLTLTQALHANRTVIVNKADGCDLVLPEATGTNDVYTLIFGTALTSNTHTVTTADTTNANFVGHVQAVDLDAATVAVLYQSVQATGNDTITLNMTSQGGITPYADYYVLTDIATDVWKVEGKFVVPTSSNPATPFSSVA